MNKNNWYLYLIAGIIIGLLISGGIYLKCNSKKTLPAPPVVISTKELRDSMDMFKKLYQVSKENYDRKTVEDSAAIKSLKSEANAAIAKYTKASESADHLAEIVNTQKQPSTVSINDYEGAVNDAKTVCLDALNKQGAVIEKQDSMITDCHVQLQVCQDNNAKIQWGFDTSETARKIEQGFTDKVTRQEAKEEKKAKFWQKVSIGAGIAAVLVALFK